MYLCCTLFFTKQGTKIGWVYLHYMHDLKSMKDYDWCEAIRYTLMNSIEKYQLRPEKVSGCVITLLYWLCEHTTILGAENNKVYPRLLKWNIPKLQSSIKENPLDSIPDEKVSDAELRQTTCETSFYGFENNLMLEEGTEKIKSGNNLLIRELEGENSRLEKTVSELREQVSLLNGDNLRLGAALEQEPTLTQSFKNDVLYKMLTLADRNKLDNISRKRTNRPNFGRLEREKRSDSQEQRGITLYPIDRLTAATHFGDLHFASSSQGSDGEDCNISQRPSQQPYIMETR